MFVTIVLMKFEFVSDCIRFSRKFEIWLKDIEHKSKADENSDNVSLQTHRL